MKFDSSWLLGFMFCALSSCAAHRGELSREKIIGGTLSTHAHLMAGIVSYSENAQPDDEANFFCGAAVIEKDLALTAAHCVFDLPEGKNEKIGLVYGTNDYRVKVKDVIPIRAIIVHPNYNPISNSSDIAILVLAGEMRPSTEFYSVNQNIDYPASEGSFTVMGFGTRTSYGKVFPLENRTALMEAEIQIVGYNDCRQNNFSLNQFPSYFSTQSILCGGDLDEGGKDACQGDSGGPAFTNINGKPTLVGLVSFGFGCGQSSSPGVYTSTAYYSDWIQQTAENFRQAYKNPSKDQLGFLIRSMCRPFGEELPLFPSLTNIKISDPIEEANFSGSLFDSVSSCELQDLGISVKLYEKNGDYIFSVDQGGHSYTVKSSAEYFEANCEVDNVSIILYHNLTNYTGLVFAANKGYLIDGVSRPISAQHGNQINVTDCEVKGKAYTATPQKFTILQEILNNKAKIFLEQQSGSIQKANLPLTEISSSLDIDAFDEEPLEIKFNKNSSGDLQVSFKNTTGVDIFSWQLSCTEDMTLKKSDKIWKSFMTKGLFFSDKEFIHDFTDVNSPNYKILKNQMVVFDVELSNSFDPSRLRCKLNGEDLKIAWM